LLEILACRRHAWCGGASMHECLGEKQWESFLMVLRSFFRTRSPNVRELSSVGKLRATCSFLLTVCTLSPRSSWTARTQPVSVWTKSRFHLPTFDSLILMVGYSVLRARSKTETAIWVCTGLSKLRDIVDTERGQCTRGSCQNAVLASLLFSCVQRQQMSAREISLQWSSANDRHLVHLLDGTRKRQQKRKVKIAGGCNWWNWTSCLLIVRSCTNRQNKRMLSSYSKSEKQTTNKYKNKTRIMSSQLKNNYSIIPVPHEA